MTMSSSLRLTGLLALFAAAAAISGEACPDSDWVQFESACYWRSPFQLTWRRITDVCASIAPGAIPVSIHSFTQNAFLAETLMKGERAWLGLHRNGSHISWEWQDRSAYNRYYWGCNEPSYEGECCAVINHGGMIGEWAAFSCDDEEYFICRVNAD